MDLDERMKAAREKFEALENSMNFREEDVSWFAEEGMEDELALFEAIEKVLGGKSEFVCSEDDDSEKLGDVEDAFNCVGNPYGSWSMGLRVDYRDGEKRISHWTRDTGGSVSGWYRLKK